LLTAMVTPLGADGGVNYVAAARLARLLVADGSDGVVVAGTTGEAPTLSDNEKIQLVREVRAAIPGKTVIAGTGSNDTRHSIELSERAAAAGADAVLCVVPYYNKPTQDGIYRHYEAIATASGVPVVMYNIVGRSAVNMTVETTLRCAQIPGVIGVKEASGDIDQMTLICAGKPDGFSVWAGDDSFTLPILAVGGIGGICVITHVAGMAMRQMISSFEAGDVVQARSIHQRLLPVIKAIMTTASNPIPIKSLLTALGFDCGPLRLPLTAISSGEMARLLETVKAAGDLITFTPGVRV
jgi:4-hydroxy-tetrahydrodipicolinate synthase